MKKYSFLLNVLVMISIIMTQNAMCSVNSQQLELLPAPQNIEILEGTFNPEPGTSIWVPEISQMEVLRSAEMLQKLLESRRLPSETTKEWVRGKCSVSLKIRPELVPQPDGYRIRILSRFRARRALFTKTGFRVGRIL